MIVENDLKNLGDLQFYEVPLNSTTKLIGPTAVREALDKDPTFAELKTLLRNPRIGDNILYQVGEHDVYFIPVYTAGAGGVVAQLGTIAAVGAAFTGEYYVGLGDTQEEAFEAYLKKVSGVAGSSTSVDVDYIELGKSDRIDIIKSSFKEMGIEASPMLSLSKSVWFVLATLGQLSILPHIVSKSISFKASYLQTSHASPMLSLSTSDWFVLAIVGQLSTFPQTPSESMSLSA